MTERKIMSEGTFGRVYDTALSSVESMLFPLNGTVYFVSDNRFTTVDCDGKSFSGSSYGGEEFQGDLDDFVKSALEDPNFAGIVPLSIGVYDLVRKRGLEGRRGGEVNSPVHPPIHFILYPPPQILSDTMPTNRSELATGQKIIEGDLEGLAVLVTQLANELYDRSDKSRSPEEYANWFRNDEIESARDKVRYWSMVLRVGEEPAGYIVGERESCIPEAYYPGSVLDVAIVYTSPQYRRQGVGKALVERLVDDAHTNPEINSVSARVGDKNEPSLRIFRRLGFQEREKGRVVYFTKNV